MVSTRASIESVKSDRGCDNLRCNKLMTECVTDGLPGSDMAVLSALFNVVRGLRGVALHAVMCYSNRFSLRPEAAGELLIFMLFGAMTNLIIFLCVSIICRRRVSFLNLRAVESCL